MPEERSCKKNYRVYREEMKKEISSGGIVLKKQDNKTLLLLVEHKDNAFVFPKGHIEAGESAEEAAKREIKEEVGLTDIIVGERLGTVTRHSTLPNGRIVTKDIVLFLIIVNDYNHSDCAQESYQWFDLEQASKKLRYAEDVYFLNQIFDKIKKIVANTPSIVFNLK